MQRVTISLLSLTVYFSCAAAAQPAAAPDPMSQERLKADYMLRVSEFTRGFDKQMFSKWICLGKPAKFRERIGQDSIKIKVDSNITSCASYDPKKQVLTIKHMPRAFSFSTLSSGTSSLLLWHEAVHAISHGHQIGAIKPSRPFKGAPKKTAMTPKGNLPAESGVGTAGSLTASGQQKYTAWAEEAVDHLYINWVESCMEGLQMLTMLEKQLVEHGKSPPPDDVKARTQRYWKKFVELTNSSGFGQVPDDKERKELEDMTGFRCEVAEILSGYLDLGYPMEYFGNFVTDEQVWKLFPTAEQLGTVGIKETKKVTQLGKLYRNYLLSYKQGPPGRSLAIHLSLYGSPKISTAVWEALKKHPIKNTRTEVPGVGESAYTIDRGARNSKIFHARFWNAGIMMTDLTVSGSLETGDLKIIPRPPRPQIVQKLFKNIEALGSPPIPPGVMTSPPKKK